MKKLLKAIESTKKKLILKVEQNGIYENFGQKEVMKLEEKFIDISSYSEEMNRKRALISSFDEWCMEYTGV